MIKCELIVEKDGKVVYRDISKSFVQNIGKILGVILSSPGGTPTSYAGAVTSAVVTDTTGSSATVYGEYYTTSGTADCGGTPAAASAADNDDSYGIVVGSGVTPVSPTDYMLAAKISHGTGSGQLDYDTHTILTSYTSTSSYIEISRVFVNRSGADVVVREVGLIVRNYWKSRYNLEKDVKFLIARDVLPSPTTVKNLGSLNVRYRISLAVT